MGGDPPGWLHNGSETSVSSSAVEVLAGNRERKKLVVQNTGADSCRIGSSGVGATSGFRLPAGERVTFDAPFCPVSAIYAIRDGSSDTTVLAMEVTG